VTHLFTFNLAAWIYFGASALWLLAPCRSIREILLMLAATWLYFCMLWSSKCRSCCSTAWLQEFLCGWLLLIGMIPGWELFSGIRNSSFIPSYSSSTTNMSKSPSTTPLILILVHCSKSISTRSVSSSHYVTLFVDYHSMRMGFITIQSIRLLV